MIEFMTTEKVKEIAESILDKITKMHELCNDPIIVNTYLQKMSIKDQTIVEPHIRKMKEIQLKLNDMSEDELENLFLQSCNRSAIVLNIYLLAGIDVEKIPQGKMSDSKLNELMEDTKQALVKIKEFLNPIPEKVKDEIWD